MSGRFQPSNGADSMDYTMLQMDALQEPYVLKHFRVLVCDRFDEDDRRWVDVPKAIGEHDAFNQVREDYPQYSVLAAEEVLVA